MRKAAVLAGLLAFAATPALAHPGHPESGLVAGLMHPFTGLDHLLVMVAVGLWAGLALGRGRLLWPLAFVAFMLGGFALGVGGAPLPGVEAVILASLLALGLAIGLELKVSAALGAAIIAVFAMAHGYAHGQDAPAGGALPFAAGFAVSTVVLHLGGLGLARIIQNRESQTILRLLGFGVAATGLALAFV